MIQTGTFTRPVPESVDLGETYAHNLRISMKLYSGIKPDNELVEETGANRGT